MRAQVRTGPDSEPVWKNRVNEERGTQKETGRGNGNEPGLTVPVSGRHSTIQYCLEGGAAIALCSSSNMATVLHVKKQNIITQFTKGSKQGETSIHLYLSDREEYKVT